MTSLPKGLLLSLFLFAYFLHIPQIIFGAQISSKKGVGMAMVDHCNTSSNPADCWQQMRNLTNSLGANWYYTWFVWNNHAQKMGSLNFVPMISKAGSNADRSYTTSELNSFKTYAVNNPGSYWLIWNEPDYWQQSNIPVTVASKIYKPLREAILSSDPTAKLIIGGMWDHAHWIDWARSFRDSYKAQYGVFPKYEGWHGHMYTCGQSYNKDSWRNTITSFRNWIDINGGGELWMTEFGCLDYDHYQIISDQFDWMETYSGIQRYAWFVASSKEAGSSFAGGNLLKGRYGGTPNLSLSPLGEFFARYPQNSNPIPTSTPPPPTPTPTSTPTVPSYTPTPTPTSRPTSTISPPASCTRPGDANNDNLINGIDFVIWLNNFGQTTNNACRQGDFNNDRAVDGVDYVIWFNNFGI